MVGQMRSQEPESGTVIGTAKARSDVVDESVEYEVYLLTQHAADDESGECVECSLVAHAADDDFGEYVECSLATHGADDEPGEYPECSLATHRTNDLVIWTSDRTEFRGEFEAEDGSDCPSRLSSRVAVGQAPEAYVRVAKFGVGQENFIRSTSGS
ncbi:hypothetical protein PR003_g18081 [Phytophthora rubi]|uniref:Uncharacterized protein n=1 Tax=Phytophthora rubi TaxID=129364 RepID=A0A6A4EJW1_9STRA|nr:hypothetical protein PR003_g18081 [Phytophthora rubi]